MTFGPCPSEPACTSFMPRSDVVPGSRARRGGCCRRKGRGRPRVAEVTSRTHRQGPSWALAGRVRLRARAPRSQGPHDLARSAVSTRSEIAFGQDKVGVGQGERILFGLI